MKVLLDTHAFLWWSTNDRRLRAEARRAITNAEAVFVSAASAWEVAIKIAAKRIRLEEDFTRLVARDRFDELPVTFVHTRTFATLPRENPDPFDRMLIAQADVEGLTIVTHDRGFESYRIPVIWT